MIALLRHNMNAYFVASAVGLQVAFHFRPCELHNRFQVPSGTYYCTPEMGAWVGDPSEMGP